jgi:hypothetical protein
VKLPQIIAKPSLFFIGSASVLTKKEKQENIPENNFGELLQT